MSRKAYLVVGPESSGTRIVTRLFVEAGCVGSFEHSQPLDKFLRLKRMTLDNYSESEKFVLRRSVPHGTKFPDLKHINDRFVANGCKTTWIILLREWTALALSRRDRDTHGLWSKPEE